MSAASGNPRSHVHIDPYDVEVQLADLGAKRVWFEDAAWQGQIERRFTSPLEFPGAPAYKAASKGLEVVRERSAKEEGWHPGIHLGISVAFNNDETVAITVTEGDEFTGLLGEKDPSTKAYKGPNTKKVADDNRLFPDPPVSFWYLLTRSDDDDVLWAELSSPSLERGGHVVAWDQRILLGEIDWQTPKGAAAPASLPPATEAPQINLRRRPA